MAVKYTCDKCGDEPGITTQRFAGGIDVVVVQTQSPTHYCLNCLGESLLSAVTSLDVPCARDLADTRKRASEASRAYAQVERAAEEIASLKAKLQEARAEATPESQYAAWLTERADLLTQIDEHKQAREVAEAKAAQLERAAANQAKQADAAAKQAAQEDPAYLSAVAAREAKRVAGANR